VTVEGTETERQDMPVGEAPTLRLRWQDDSGARDEVVVDEAVLCGSSPSCAVVVAVPTVSRVHAEITRRGDGAWIRDLGSSNGTYVDDLRVAEAQLPDGARLRLGGATLQVSYERRRSALPPWPYDQFGQLLGASLPMREMFAVLARAAATQSSVLVTSETGTGKELVARAIHEASPRAEGPFVVVDCAALPENLLEAELFGHARGAFTGAVAARAGAFADASGGTLFLDEIGELPLAMQPKLLRALESRAVRRVGETAYQAVDVRVVAATHRDLGKMVACGAFREDLYFRLAVLPLRVPPLRSRRSDVPLLLDRFLGQSALAVFGPERLRLVAARPWLGNVRELRNFAERALAFGPDHALALMDPEGDGAGDAPAKPAEGEPEAPDPSPESESYSAFRERWIDRGEAAYVRRLLELHGGNVTKAAQAGGIARGHVYRLIKKHGLGGA
jgi:DNA-binding NtrC family response regulator